MILNTAFNNIKQDFVVTTECERCKLPIWFSQSKSFDASVHEVCPEYHGPASRSSPTNPTSNGVPMDSAFNPQTFLDAQQTTANEKRPLIDAGWYTAVVGEIPPENVKSGQYGKGERIGQPWLQVRVPLRLQLPPEVQSKGLPAEFQLTDGVFIDLTATGQVDNGKGKNNRQRQYREALGMNKPGEPFAWRMATGRPLRVEVKHVVLQDGNIVENIGGVLPA